MEHIILSNIMSHVETHGILSDVHFRFCKCRSAKLQLLQTIRDVAFSLDNRDIILLGFSKAFDKV